jgi:transcription antitermination protein NusB
MIDEVSIMKLDLRTLRVELMQLLYQYDLYKSDQLPYIPVFESENTSEIFYAILDLLDEIDQLIESHLFDYKLYRLSFVDRAIIRLSVFELMKTDLDKRIIIDEAIELTKTYSNLDDMKQHKFNNKVIDAIAKTIRG